MIIHIETIPHEKQRYDTVGDWVFHNEGLTITVSRLGNWKYEMCVAVHELVEALLCTADGVSQKDVDAFDIEFEKERAKKITLDTSEPGDHPNAPYRIQHFVATTVERIVALALGVSWTEYEKTINSL